MILVVQQLCLSDAYVVSRFQLTSHGPEPARRLGEAPEGWGTGLGEFGPSGISRTLYPLFPEKGHQIFTHPNTSVDRAV